MEMANTSCLTLALSTTAVTTIISHCGTGHEGGSVCQVEPHCYQTASPSAVGGATDKFSITRLSVS